MTDSHDRATGAPGALTRGSRIRAALAAAAAEERAALVAYLTAGDPSPDETPTIVAAAFEAGADVVELGVPFSDPNADGVVIQEAMQRALAAGGGLSATLEVVRRVRERGCEGPIVLFGYYNPIFVRGVDRFAAEAEAAGADAALTVDLPVDEAAELAGPLAVHGLDVVPLVAPTTSIERVAAVRPLQPSFVYYISMTGITGAAFQGTSGGPERVAAIRAAAGAPVAVGFGIKTADDARAVATYADAVVVGSAIVRRIAEAGPGRAAQAVADLVAELRAGLSR
ncbi:tryptophan synthase subunit alpha [Haliangium sp.]|uniref:tryptophan synthase subunit alpha n=1 Tax=Haliangium sp. TaxID=2663208 RepID=UPI003D122E73